MILALMEKSNYYTAGGQMFKETAQFGSAQMFVYETPERMPDSLAHCKTNTIGEFVWGLNPHDEVGSSQTKYRMTAWQVAKRFSKKKDYSDMPSAVQVQMKANQPNLKYDVYHAVFPNDLYKQGKMGREGYKWRSVWYWGYTDDNEVLEDKGFYTNPMICVRAMVDGCSVYGRGDGMEALGDTKMLQKIEQYKTQALGNQIAPPLVAPIGMKPLGLKLYPNAINYCPQGVATDQIKPVFEFQFPLKDAQAEIAVVEARVKEMLHYNEFLAVLSMDKEATAFEVAKRIEEKITIIGPTLDYLKKDFIAPSVERFFNILLLNRLLPPPPQELAGAKLKLEYTGVLAQAQQMIGASTYEQSLAYAERVNALNPQALQVIDWDENLRTYFDMVGMPPDNTIAEDKVQQMRAQQAQEAQHAKDLQAAQSMAETAKTASQANLGNGNLAEHVAGAAGIPQAGPQPAGQAA